MTPSSDRDDPKRGDAKRPDTKGGEPARAAAKKGPPKDLAKPTHPQSAGPSASPSTRPPDPAGATPRVAAPKDSMKEVMPAGEAGSRNPPRTRAATGSGGTSGAEDTTRAAGYVADFARPRDVGPGGPAEPMPTYLDAPEGPPRDASGKPRPERAPKPAPKPPPAPGRGGAPSGPKESKGR
jgi:hypothetical protein